MDKDWFAARELQWSDIEWAYLYNALVDAANYSDTLIHRLGDADSTIDDFIVERETLRDQIRRQQNVISEGSAHNKKLVDNLSDMRAELREMGTHNLRLSAENSNLVTNNAALREDIANLTTASNAWKERFEAATSSDAASDSLKITTARAMAEHYHHLYCGDNHVIDWDKTISVNDITYKDNPESKRK